MEVFWGLLHKQFLMFDKTDVLYIMRNNMTSSSIPDTAAIRLQDFGARIRARRKALGALREASRDYDNPMLGELLRAAVPEFTPMAPSFDITGGASTVIPFPGRGGRA